MNIVGFFANDLFSCVKERGLLNFQQRKILVVASIALECLTVLYAMIYHMTLIRFIRKLIMKCVFR